MRNLFKRRGHLFKEERNAQVGRGTELRDVFGNGGRQRDGEREEGEEEGESVRQTKKQRRDKNPRREATQGSNNRPLESFWLSVSPGSTARALTLGEQWRL